MIKNAKFVPKFKTLAKKLQSEQMQHWITTRKDPDEVFHLFKLDKAGKNLFSIPEFTAWVKYVDDLNANSPKEPASMIPMLRKYFPDDVLLRMTESAKVVEGTKSIATKLDDDMLRVWLSSRKTPDKAFGEFGLQNSVDTLLENPLLNFWTKYIEAYNTKYPDRKMTMIETFTRAFNDERVAKILVEGRAKDTTRKIATKFYYALLKMWWSSGKSVDDVFELLKLYESRLDFSRNPLLNTWVAYMNTVLTENPSKTTTLYTKLTSSFGDRPLIQILEAAKKFPGMESTATRIQTEKIQSIFASMQSPEKVFKLVGLDNMKDTLLSNPLFKTWLDYVKVFNKENPTKHESRFLPLHVHYQWGGVEQMINRGIQNPSTLNMAEKVENGWLKFWLDKHKRPKDAFSFLHLDKAGEKTLSDPKFVTWTKYLDDFNQRYPDQKTTVIDGLRANYNDRALLRIFDMAKEDPSTKKLGSNLQSALIDKWLAAKVEPASLKQWYSDVPTSEEMIQRYTKKLGALSGNTL